MGYNEFGSVKASKKEMTPPENEDVNDSPPPYSLDSASSSSLSLSSSLCSSSSTSSLNPKSLGELQAQALGQHPSTTSSSSSGLPKPIAIPATVPKFGSPFLRAYPSSLESFAIPRDTFLHFLDDLNRVAVASPPLQVLGPAGTVVRFVPVHEAQLAGTIISNVTGLGAKAISKGRTELHLHTANKEIFHPRGLKVEIAKLNTLAKLANMPILNAKGKVNKKSALLGPIEDSEALKSMTGQERRLKSLEPWIAPLDLMSVPDIEVTTNPLSKLNVSASEWQRRRGEKTVDKSLEQALNKKEKRSTRHEERHERRLVKIERRLEKAEQQGDSERVEKLERKGRRVDRKHERKTDRIDRKRGRDKKEARRMRRILWLVVRNVDADSGPGVDPYTDDAEEGTSKT